MRTLLIIILFSGLLFSQNTLADGPPHPPQQGHGYTQNSPSMQGGGASLDGGFTTLIALSVLYFKRKKRQ